MWKINLLYVFFERRVSDIIMRFFYWTCVKAFSQYEIWIALNAKFPLLLNVILSLKLGQGCSVNVFCKCARCDVRGFFRAGLLEGRIFIDKLKSDKARLFIHLLNTPKANNSYMNEKFCGKNSFNLRVNISSSLKRNP